MLRISIKSLLSENEKLRRGSVGHLLVFVFAVLLIMLPIGMTGIRQLRQQILIQRAQQYLQELLPAACAGLSQSDLADGQAKFLTTTTRALINDRFARDLPPLLAGKFRLTQVRFTTRRLTPDANHWMGDDQPQSQPIIICQAELTDYRGQVIIISRTLEFLLD